MPVPVFVANTVLKFIIAIVFKDRLVYREQLLTASNTRALDYLPWLDQSAGAELPEEYRTLARQIEGLNFDLALETLRGLAKP